MRTVVSAALALCVAAALSPIRVRAGEGAGPDRVGVSDPHERRGRQAEQGSCRRTQRAGQGGLGAGHGDPPAPERQTARLGRTITLTPRQTGQPAKAAEAKPEPKEVTKVFRLKNAKAASVAKTLESLYGQRKGRLASDDRTNSLVVIATGEHLLEIAVLIEELDAPAAEEKGKAGR